MPWQIDHQCPQCGGPITLEETDRFFVCGFCRVRLYITSKGPFQYYLSPKGKKDGLTYLPYWRILGMIYTIRGTNIHHRILDTSRIAVRLKTIPFSLGARPQTQHLRFSMGKLDGNFIPHTVPLTKVLSDAEHQLAELGVDVAAHDPIEKVYIGETTSIIYAPYIHLDSVWVDAIQTKYKYVLDQSADIPSEDLQSADNWSPQFFPAMCPDCGWDLNGKGESCAFICDNCSTAWASSPAGLKRVKMGASLKQGEHVVYIPFWRIRPAISGEAITSYADLVRFANLPKVVQPKWETTPLYFWAPAFKIHPSFFLRLGGMLTISPPEDIQYEDIRLKKVYPVTLPLEEGVESLKIIFASLVVSKRKNYVRLPEINFSAEESELIFLPFVSKGNEFIYEKQNIAIQKVAMTYGRKF
jgi:hypothetical protein